MANPSVTAANIAKYNSDGFSEGETALIDPTWEQVRTHIEEMNRHELPWVWLCKTVVDGEPNGESDAMTILGGNNVFHVSIIDADGDFTEAVDTSKDDDDDEIVEVWTSDQGFATLTRNTIGLTETLAIAEWYFANGDAKPGTAWE
jgi:hypothetical protein